MRKLKEYQAKRPALPLVYRRALGNALVPA
jgi:hypothetical protein